MTSATDRILRHPRIAAFLADALFSVGLHLKHTGKGGLSLRVTQPSPQGSAGRRFGRHRHAGPSL